MKSLNEQKKRMQELMGFTYKDNSHDILSEENFKSIEVVENNLLSEQDGEPNWEWVEKELQKAKTITTTKPECFMVGSADNRIKGVFEATVTEGSTAVTDFVKILMEKIKNNENAKKYLGKGGNFTIEEMDIIAGASNSISGSITPTMDNNYKPLNITKGSPEDLKYKHKIGSDKYNQNMGYAKGRGEGVRDGLIKAFSKIDGFDMDGDKIKISNHIIDTGGKIDKDSSSPNEGQVVLVFMKVCWVNTTETRVPAVVEQFKRCMGGLSVQVNYSDTSKGHKCNNGTFKIFANGIHLERTGWGTNSNNISASKSEYADLNNGSKNDEILDERGEIPIGSTVFNEFKIEGPELAALVKLDNLKKYKGGLQITAECIETGGKTNQQWFDKRSQIWYYGSKDNLLPSQYIRKKDGRTKFSYSTKGELQQGGVYWLMQNHGMEICKKLECSDFDPNKEYTDSQLLTRIRKEYGKNTSSVQVMEKLMDYIDNPNENRFGCHKGVANIKILQNDSPVDTQTVTTPRYADNVQYTLGPEMEACNGLWSKVVDDSKNQS
tara:strand:+ start:1001 stop:2650 length:1650 start_codon:yes stop_codon:yes gene_type:complete